jgi:hypothetical protein
LAKRSARNKNNKRAADEPREKWIHSSLQGAETITELEAGKKMKLRRAKRENPAKNKETGQPLSQDGWPFASQYRLGN